MTEAAVKFGVVNKCGLLMPTKNRQDICLRQLIFYALEKSPHPIYISDASDAPMSEAQQRLLTSLTDVLDIYYFYDNDLNDVEAIEFLINECKESYCAYIGDDDYLIPAGISRAIEYLIENESVRIVSGESWLLESDLLDQSNRISFKHISPYFMVNRVEQDVMDRLRAHAMEYWVTLFGVHRTREFKEDWLHNTKMKSRYFTELMPNFIGISRGAAVVLRQPFLIRTNHHGRAGYVSPLKRMHDDNWMAGLELGLSVLGDSLIERGVHKSNAADFAFEVFETYFSRWVGKHYGQPQRYRMLVTSLNRVKRIFVRLTLWVISKTHFGEQSRRIGDYFGNLSYSLTVPIESETDLEYLRDRINSTCQ